MKKKEEKVAVTISSNFGQNKKEAEDFGQEMSKLLKPLKEAGLLDFKRVTKRICDFCGKTLEEKDKFKTIGDKDKCEDCQKAGK